LPPGDPRYVLPPEGARGEGDQIVQVTNAMRWSDTPLHLLFAGHRGGGKSTELLRLKEKLANPPAGERRFFVVHFEADEEDIDVNDADVPDLLLSIIRQVGKALREAEGIDLRPTWLTKYVDGLKALLGSEVEFQQLQLDLKIAKFTAAIKSSPDERRKIRDALEPNVSNILSAANELLDEAVIRLKKKGYANLALIVDNLDRIVLRDVPGSQFNTHEQLFINRGDQLAQIGCHVIYTLPISMVFSPRATALVRLRPATRRPANGEGRGSLWQGCRRAKSYARPSAQAAIRRRCRVIHCVRFGRYARLYLSHEWRTRSQSAHPSPLGVHRGWGTAIDPPDKRTRGPEHEHRF
jgi:hypothetical protein